MMGHPPITRPWSALGVLLGALLPTLVACGDAGERRQLSAAWKERLEAEGFRPLRIDRDHVVLKHH